MRREQSWTCTWQPDRECAGNSRRPRQLTHHDALLAQIAAGTVVNVDAKARGVLLELILPVADDRERADDEVDVVEIRVERLGLVEDVDAGAGRGHQGDGSDRLAWPCQIVRW